MALVKKLKNDDLEKSFKIVVENKDFIVEYNKEIAKLQTKVKVDGFRKGKVPLDVIKKKYSANILAETCEKIINEEIKKLIDDNKFKLASRAKIDIKDYAEDQDLEFEATLELLPDIPEIKYNKIKIKKQNIKVEKKDIEEEKKHILRNKADWEVVTEVAKNGDKVKLDFLGKIDDVEFEGGKAEGYELILGSNSFIDTFEKQLEGKKSGDKVEVKVKFPENYGKKELANKPAVFECKIHEVSRPQFPDLTKEFLKTNFNLESIEKLEEEIEKELKKAYENNTKNKVKKEIFDWIAENIKLDLPKSLVETELKRQVNDKTTDKEKIDITKNVEKELKLSLVFSDIAEKNDIKVDRNEIVQEVYKIARKYPGQEQMFADFYLKNQQLLNQISAQIIEEKVVDYMIKNATVEEVEVNIDEFLKNK
ncbi:MAG: trigger factor [Rickettsiales bacterium]|jgi:trigger factor|nr:trigger factor [Rickettsiales bacterium]